MDITNFYNYCINENFIDNLKIVIHPLVLFIEIIHNNKYYSLHDRKYLYHYIFNLFYIYY